MDPRLTMLGRTPTPAAIVDVEIAAANHERLTAAAGHLVLRPHFKAHKTSALLDIQCAGHRGAICTQTAAEAAVAATLADDIVVTNQVVDRAALLALAEAARTTSVSVLVDSPIHVDILGELTRRERVEIGVLIEVDVGMHRCGLGVDDPMLGRLAAQVAGTTGLVLRGVQGYEGHAAAIVDPLDRRHHVDDAAQHLAHALAALRGAFVDPPLVGGGATSTTPHVRHASVWTETQAGSYLLMDGAYGAMTDLPYRQALFILTTVLHRAGRRAVVDAGLKAVAVDRGAPQPVHAGWSIERVSDEHAVIGLGDGADPCPQIGDRVLLVPGHVDPTMNLYPEVALVRGAADPARTVDLIELVPVDGRRRAAG